MTLVDEVRTEHVETHLRLLKEAGSKISPATAEVTWWYVNCFDVYGLEPDLPDVAIGRGYFARAPGSDIWVEFGDLPDQTSAALWTMYGSKLLFPSGLLDPPRTFGPASTDVER